MRSDQLLALVREKAIEFQARGGVLPDIVLEVELPELMEHEVGPMSEGLVTMAAEASARTGWPVVVRNRDSRPKEEA